MTVTARLVDDRGAMRRNVQLQFDAARFARGETDVNLTLPLAGLDPGEYLLAIDAATSTHTASRNVRFTVTAAR